MDVGGPGATRWSALQAWKVVCERPDPRSDVKRNRPRAVFELVVAVRADEDAAVDLFTQRLKLSTVRPRDVEALQARIEMVERKRGPVVSIAAQLTCTALVFDHPAFSSRRASGVEREAQHEAQRLRVMPGLLYSKRFPHRSHFEDPLGSDPRRRVVRAAPTSISRWQIEQTRMHSSSSRRTVVQLRPKLCATVKRFLVGSRW
jgi:hypothetical protein